MAYVGNRQSNSIQTNPQLRWYMFSKFQYEISNLQHILLSLRNTSASPFSVNPPKSSITIELRLEKLWWGLLANTCRWVTSISCPYWTEFVFFVKPNVQLIDVYVGKMLCNVWTCASVATARLMMHMMLLIMSLNILSLKTKNMLSTRILSFRHFV